MRGARRIAGPALGAALALGSGLAGSCRTLPAGRPATVPAPGIGALVESLVPAPVLRVGILTGARRVSVGCDSGVRVRGIGGPDREVARATFEPVSSSKPAARFRVQVASLVEESGAREVADEVRRVSGLEPTIRFNAETGSHQVRLGDFATREEALALATRLDRQGLPGGWVVEEAGGPEGKIRLLETGEEYAQAILISSQREEALSVDGTPYRGLVEVHASETIGLTVVNIVNLEDYLKGVVPNELSPESFPHIEALKAQAVAARSYALRNRGQFVSEGYDICATPRCQLYRGRGSERPLSDRAVEETRGIVADYQGAPINALYTSTCGGHTEDASNVFEGESAPYLRGVACAPERNAWASIRTLEAPRDLGSGLNHDAALLLALDVLDPELYSPAPLRGAATEGEVQRWVSSLVAALRRKGCQSAAEPPLARRGTFFRHLLGSICWEERGRRLLGPEDVPYLLHIEDRDDLAGDAERLAAAALIQEGVLSPFSDNTLRPNATLTRAQAVSILAQVAVKAGAPGLASAEFQGATAGQITVKTDTGVASHPLDPAVRLFRSLSGTPAAVSELNLAKGDRVRFVLQDGRVTFLEGEQSRLGAAADHAARYYRWEVRLSPEEVARAVARYGSVGAVKDVLPRRLGVSGRVIEMAVVGTDGEIVLQGLQVRWGLGLRENLFVVDREVDPTGAVERFVFTGKGWGHGVGLCQVGAYGMAQAGASYENILRHYYTGISIDKAY